VAWAGLYEDWDKYNPALMYAREALEWSRRLNLAQEKQQALIICQWLETLGAVNIAID